MLWEHLLFFHTTHIMQCVAVASSSGMQQLRATTRGASAPSFRAAPRSLSLNRGAEASSSGLAAPGVRALPLTSTRRRQQQQTAVCSLTSHPGEVRSASGAAAGQASALPCRRVDKPKMPLLHRNHPVSPPPGAGSCPLGSARACLTARHAAIPRQGTHSPAAAARPRPPLLLQERAGNQGADELRASYSIPTTAMAKGLGSSGGSATLQRSKLSNKQSLSQTGPKLDDGMGGGGIGKGIFNGGGGDGDDGDDDEYSDDFGGCCRPACAPCRHSGTRQIGFWPAAPARESHPQPPSAAPQICHPYPTNPC